MPIRHATLTVLALAVLCHKFTRAAQMQVWTQSTGNKVQPTTAPTSGKAVTVETAQNSYEGYQIIVRAYGGDLTGVNMKTSALLSASGGTIPASSVTFFRQAFIDFKGVDAVNGAKPVPKESPTKDSRLPDPLIPFIDPYSKTPRAAGAPFKVKSGLNQPCWVDFHIAKNTKPGIYKGMITVTATGQTAVTVPLSLTVWDIVLPDMRDVSTFYSMNTNNIIDYHSGTWSCEGSDCWVDWSPRTRAIVKRYEELAHTHRIDTGQQFTPDPGNGCSVPTNWAEYDAAMKPYFTGAYWSDKVPSGRMEAPFTPGSDWGLQTCTQGQYTTLAKAWAAHLKAKGWLNHSYVYALDEPDEAAFKIIAKHSGWLQDGDQAWKQRIILTKAPRKDNVDIFNPAVGIYVVPPAAYDDWWDATAGNYGRDDWPSLFAKGLKLWFYDSNSLEPPYANYAANTLLGLEPRMLKWASWYEKATGFLYWDIMSYAKSYDAWGPNIDFAKTGDGVLVYPGNHNGLQKPKGSPSDVNIDGPIPSYRLKIIRAGLQDWTLFRLAEQRGLKEYARQQVARAYSQLGACYWEGCDLVNGKWMWKEDDGLMLEIRSNIAKAVAAARK